MRTNVKAKIVTPFDWDNECNAYILKCPLCKVMFLDSSKPDEPCYCPSCTVEISIPTWILLQDKNNRKAL